MFVADTERGRGEDQNGNVDEAECRLLKRNER